jgi:hypothetical protein
MKCCGTKKKKKKQTKDEFSTLVSLSGRGRGRAGLGWIKNVEDDLRKLGVKRWRTKALDRVEWTSIIGEAKAKLKGP